MENKKNNLTVLCVLLCSLWQPVLAEISGSGTPNSGCLGQLDGFLWHDIDADEIADPGEPGLAEVAVYLFYNDGSSSLSATTNAAGQYQFNYLCGGAYLAVIDEATVPEGLIAPDLPGAGASDFGGWSIEVDATTATTFNRGFSSCDLGVNASCTVGSLASELYRCEKQIDVLSMIWDGTQAVRIVAYEGKTDDPVLAEFDHVAPGDLVTVSGYAEGPDDVIWEVFAAGTNEKLGESKFRIDCDDTEMDGPEDCGLPQGNGKDNKAEFINEWLLDGVVDDSGLLECTNRRTAAGTCELQSLWADCELVDKVRWLTFTYTGGGCGVSNHDQPRDFECDGTVDSNVAATVETEAGDTFTVQPGETFTVPAEGGDTDIELTNANGTEVLRIKTSCSEPLAAGDIFGSLTLVALNGLGTGGQVEYEYELENKGNLAVTANALEAPWRTLYQSSFAIEPQTTRTVAGAAYVTATTTSALLAEPAGANRICAGADFVGVIVTPPSPCEISGSGVQFHNDEILWNLNAGSQASATIERIEVSWPTSFTDKLKEIKLDGDKIFDHETLGGVAVIEKTDLTGDLAERHIPKNQSKQLKIKFDDDIEESSIDEFDIEVHFKQGCTVTW